MPSYLTMVDTPSVGKYLHNNDTNATLDSEPIDDGSLVEYIASPAPGTLQSHTPQLNSPIS